jgi:myo-inositol 2-dehydrogenase / D-chiro-inositol 1-dehydrogenase
MVSRRQFIKSSSLATASAAAVASFPAILHAQSKPVFRAAIIGVGGRGSGAGGNFLDAAKLIDADAKIVAVADLYNEQAQKAGRRFEVPEARCFSGFDAYKKVLDLPEVNYMIIATPPGFRPFHLEAAVAAGKNIFTEKPAGTDGPGIRKVLAAYEESRKKNLKVAAGTQRRHRPSYIETVKRLHDGMIGEIRDLRAYWVNGGPIWYYDASKSHYGQQVGNTDLDVQLNNWYHYIWLCGDCITEQHVHDLDVCNWIAGAHPIRAWGMGARQQLDGKKGEIWDNFAVEYEYANGVRMHSYCGQIKREWSSVSEAAQGATGHAEMFDGRNSIKTSDGQSWRPRGIKQDNGYVLEHRDLMNAIIHDTDLNEMKQVAESTLTAIMGREAAYSGAGVEWDDMLNAKFHYGPDILFEDASKMTFGPFRTLKPPMPSEHNIFKNPPEVPTV